MRILSAEPFLEEEGIDHILQSVVVTEAVIDVDLEMGFPVRGCFDTNIEQVDAGLPVDQRLTHPSTDATEEVGVDGFEQ